MESLRSEVLQGYEVSEYEKCRAYYLRTGQGIIVGKATRSIEFEIETASTIKRTDHDRFLRLLEKAQADGLEVVIAADECFDDEERNNNEHRLAQALKEKQVKKGYNRLLSGKFEEPDYVLALATTQDMTKVQEFLQQCFRVIAESARISREKRAPNYRLNVQALLTKIEQDLEIGIDSQRFPETILGYSRHQESAKRFRSRYVRAVVQDNSCSFTYNKAMVRLVREITQGLVTPEEKSRAIFDWVTTHITYGKEKRPKDTLYRGALSTFQTREGVCGESAALQVTLERLAGNKASLVRVGKDHACAAHITDEGRVIFLETTSREGFDKQFKDFEIIGDDRHIARP